METMSKLAHSNQVTMDKIERDAENQPDEGSAFFHVTPKDTCQHDFQGWREFEDGNGGEKVCTKCGMGAMAHTLSLDF
jgi:hypothetical protein